MGEVSCVRKKHQVSSMVLPRESAGVSSAK